MIFLPLDKINIKTKKTPEQAVGILKKETQVQKRLSVTEMDILGEDKKTFAGEFDNSKFKISRVTLIVNSFLPVINGEIKEDGDGSNISIEMGLSKITAVFMLAFLAITSAFSVYSLAKIMLSQSILPRDNLGFVFSVLGYLVMMIFYKIEAKRAKKIFKQLFED